MVGVRAELEVADPPNCPVATLSTAAEGSEMTDVTWADAGDGDEVDEQFTATVDGDGPAGGVAGVDVDVEPLFETSEGTVYETTRPADDCVCAAVEALGVPVDDVQVRDGTLFVTLYLPDVETLREVVATVRERAEVRVTRLIHADGDGDASDAVPVDRSVLTDRQREVLETAYDLGYFEHPRESNATEVADALDVCPSTLVEHLSIAQGKLLTELLADRA
jgi:predicted DNA binding protein